MFDLLLLGLVEGEKKVVNKVKRISFHEKIESCGSFRPIKGSDGFPLNGRGKFKIILRSNSSNFDIQVVVDDLTISKSYSELLNETDEWTNISAYIKNDTYLLILEFEFVTFADIVIYPKEKIKFEIYLIANLEC